MPRKISYSFLAAAFALAALSTASRAGAQPANAPLATTVTSNASENCYTPVSESGKMVFAAANPGAPFIGFESDALRFAAAMPLNGEFRKTQTRTLPSTICFTPNSTIGGQYQDRLDRVTVLMEDPERMNFFASLVGRVNIFYVDVIVHEDAHRHLQRHYKQATGLPYNDAPQTAQDKIAYMLINEAYAYTQGLLTLYAHAHFLEPRIDPVALEKFYVPDMNEHEERRDPRGRAYAWLERLVALYGAEAIQTHIDETGHFPEAISRLVFAGYLDGLGDFKNRRGQYLYAEMAKGILKDDAQSPAKLITLTDDIIGDIIGRGLFGDLSGIGDLVEKHPFLGDTDEAKLAVRLTRIHRIRQQNSPIPAELASDYGRKLGQTLKRATELLADPNVNRHTALRDRLNDLLSDFGADKPGGYFVRNALAAIFAGSADRFNRAPVPPALPPANVASAQLAAAP